MSNKSGNVVKVPTIPDATSAKALAQYCPDLGNWARSWCAEESDLVRGQRIVKFFKPFLIHLLNQRLSAKTLHKHRDHLWMLGGEVIRRRHENSNLRRLAVEKATFVLLDEDGGPLIWPRISQPEQEAFDATCRKLYQFLTGIKSPDR
jgi:hypothetical protein